ncbi:6,7-dimethyl-8-ribityllumazine synthase [Demequina capsici]|uniref:6,7-dimethyl-8-ribityllumazine synthase n=1 Tax=Demequina capsici TaxID=3075620 RepID=A0AA96FEN7_9MICO|nr:6,7-dimethyl-8-ribityllumazine synthase [Demequina sp. PMTSA13]WNM28698.1 6,7-dimethyl-8-ribityllumazine synthase [Demequina sp. PMTSA13]
MSGAGAPQITVEAAGLTVEIVASSWHTEVMDGLVAGAIRAAEAAGAQHRVTRVAGAVELTVVAEALARRGADAIACLGVVIRGGTPHFEYVCQSVTQGLTDVSREHCVPVGFGVLTVDTEEQALNRAGLPGSDEDKGAEAVEAALQTALTLRSL